jgi:hypothetical protein
MQNTLPDPDRKSPLTTTSRSRLLNDGTAGLRNAALTLQENRRIEGLTPIECSSVDEPSNTH